MESWFSIYNSHIVIFKKLNVNRFIEMQES